MNRKQNSSRAETYSRLNSHWSDYGAVVAYVALARRLAADQPALASLKVPAVTEVRSEDMNNEFAGISAAPGPNNWTVPVLRTPLTPYTLVAPDGARSQVPGMHQVDPTQMPVRTENLSAGNDTRALILADSATSMMSPYLAAAFGSTMMVRHFCDNPTNAPNVPALVESYRPDVVITLMSERNFDVPSMDSDAWTAARLYDAAAGATALTWLQDSTAVSVSGADLAVPETAQPRGDLSRGQAVRLAMTAAGPDTVAIEGNADGGPFTRLLRVAGGPNVLYAVLPPGLTAAGIRLHRTGGSGALGLKALTFRALP